MRRTHRVATPLAVLALALAVVPVAAAGTTEAPVQASQPLDTPEPPGNQVLETPGPAPVDPTDHVHQSTITVADVDGKPTLVEQIVVELRVPARRRTIKRFRAPGRVGLGRRLAVTGRVPTVNARKRVKRRNRRVVVLQQRVGTRWRTIARQRAKPGGRFRVRLRGPDVPMLATVRAVAPNVKRVRGLPRRQARRQARLLPRATSRVRTIGFGSAAQVRALRKANTRKDWTYLFAGSATPQTWRRCQITWSHEARGGYSGAGGHVREAFRRIQERTRFTFAEVPYGTNNDNGAEITLHWRRPRTDPLLEGPVIGYAAPEATSDAIFEARIVLDASTELRRGFRGRDGRTWGTTLVHEISHGIGLGHAFGNRQVMYPYATSTNGVFGAGDLSGLSAVSRGCQP